MKRRTASDVLRDHARERYLRTGIRSATLDGDRGAVRRMSDSAWIDSCQLTAGVDEELLDVLGVHACESAGWTWREVLGEVQGEVYELRVERVTVPLTLAQAAAALELERTFDELRRARAAAIAQVETNMMRRAHEGAAA